MALKICHMTSTHYPKDQRIFYKECISLANAGYEVWLVEQGDSEEDTGVHIIGTGERNKGRYYRLLVRPAKVYKQAKELDADIYQFHDMELLPYGLKLKRAGKIVVFDYHEDFSSRFAYSDALPGPMFLKRFLSRIYTSYEARAIRSLDGMISVTPHFCERLKRINPNTAMITNYPLTDRGEWAKDPEYQEKSEYIAFAGQISETYRLGHIVESIQDVPGIRLKLCGPERRSGDLAKILNMDKHHLVDYLGILHYNKVPEFLSNSRASLILYEYNANAGGHLGTLGVNKLFESMLCGVPVICTDFLLWKEIIEQYRCGICVDSYNKKELKDAIIYCIEHPEEAKQMGRRGRKAVLEKYNWNIQAKNLVHFYQGLADKVLNTKRQNSPEKHKM